MVLVCPCAALTEGLVSLCIDCVCENCLNIYINIIVFFVFVILIFISFFIFIFYSLIQTSTIVNLT